MAKPDTGSERSPSHGGNWRWKLRIQQTCVCMCVRLLSASEESHQEMIKKNIFFLFFKNMFDLKPFVSLSLLLVILYFIHDKAMSAIKGAMASQMNCLWGCQV